MEIRLIPIIDRKRFFNNIIKKIEILYKDKYNTANIFLIRDEKHYFEQKTDDFFFKILIK